MLKIMQKQLFTTLILQRMLLLNCYAFLQNSFNNESSCHIFFQFSAFRVLVILEGLSYGEYRLAQSQ